MAIVLEPNVLLTSTEGWSVLRPIIGWGPAHPGRFHAEKRDPKTGAVIYRADYTIDANLLRQTTSSEKGPAIVFFGDSYTFGMGVNDADTLPQLFADRLDHKQRVSAAMDRSNSCANWRRAYSIRRSAGSHGSLFS